MFISDADLLGISAKVGTLEKGKLADIVAVPGDPLPTSPPPNASASS